MLDVLKLIFDFAELKSLFGVDAVLYAVLALVGTALFVLRLGMGLVFGGGDDFDVDADLAEGDAGFGLFSVLSITGFLMGAGWMGLVAQIEWKLGNASTAILSMIFGFTMMLLASSLMFWMRRMAHEPKADRRTAIGRTGTVYMTIPAGGTGKVRVNISGQSMTVDARTNGDALVSFTDVKVVDVRDDGVLVVEPLSVPATPAAEAPSRQATGSDAGELS